MKSNTTNQLAALAVLASLFIGASLIVLAQQTTQSELKLQPLAIKPGLWETTLMVKTAGELPVPAGMLDKLSPEQRARFEQRMKANSAARGNATTERHCLTREDLDKRNMGFATSRECTPTVTTSTSTVAKGTLSCATEGMKGNATFEAQVLDSEHVKGSAHGTMTGNGQTMNVDDSFTARWLGSSCGNVK